MSGVTSILLAATLWALQAVVARSLFNRAVEPSLLVNVRLLVAGAVLVPLALRGRRIARGQWRWVAAYSVGLASVQLTYYSAIKWSGVAVAIFLQYTGSLLVAAYESVRDRRPPPPRVLVALALALAGSGFLVLPGGGSFSGLGLAYGLGSAVAFAYDTVVSAEARRRGVPTVPLTAFALLLGSLAFLPVRTPWAALAAVPRGDWPYYLFVAIAATAIPFTLYVAALDRVRGSVAIVLAMLEPVLAALLAWLVLGEALSLGQLAGGALILGAVALLATRSSG